MKTHLAAKLKKAKADLNTKIDRLIERCDRVLMDVIHVPTKSGQKMLKTCARFAGDILLIIKKFPRMSIYELKSCDWKIIYLGDKEKLEIFIHIYFKDQNLSMTETGRIALWNIKSFTSDRLQNDADLVICEMSRIFSNISRTNIRFKVPEWINQTLQISDTPEEFIKRKNLSEKRALIKKSEKLNLKWYFSHDIHDLETFYHKMYLPFMKNRHGKMAFITKFSDHHDLWTQNGGLIYILENNQPIAGSLCVLDHNKLRKIEFALLPEKQHYYKHGIKIFLDWCAIQTAYQFGKTSVDLGSSRPLLSDPVFDNKRRWRTKVEKRGKIYSYYIFSANTLPDSLRKHINSLEIISEEKSGFFGISIQNHGETLSQSEIDAYHKKALKAGISGYKHFT